MFSLNLSKVRRINVDVKFCRVNIITPCPKAALVSPNLSYERLLFYNEHNLFTYAIHKDNR